MHHLESTEATPEATSSPVSGGMTVHGSAKILMRVSPRFCISRFPDDDNDDDEQLHSSCTPRNTAPMKLACTVHDNEHS
jgi:hypothetical protein